MQRVQESCSIFLIFLSKDPILLRVKYRKKCMTFVRKVMERIESFSCEKLKFSEVIWATFKTQIKILFFKQNLPIDEQTQTQN
jgi:hypothetical protein